MKEVYILTNQIFVNKSKDVLKVMFNYINNQPTSFLVYNAEEYPFNKFILESLKENLTLYNLPFKYNIILDNRRFVKRGKNIIFHMMPNNYNIYDASYQLNALRNIYHMLYADEVFEVFFTYHYTGLKQTCDDIRTAITQITLERFGQY
jgi:hypothetical protein